MLSISAPMRGGGAGDYYLKCARQDYYTKSLGPPGEWLGKGAEKLGLQGKVEVEPFKNLLQGLSPDGEKSLVQVQRWKDRERQCGWDLTFSAPKSVSVLWSQSSPEIRARIEACHQAAVKRVLDFIERECGVTRRGKGGRVRERVNVIYAMFQHGTSRANDPHLHTHTVLVNLSVRTDGSTGSLWSKHFYEHKMAAGAHYQIALAQELRAGMNLEVVLEKNGARIKDVPLDLCDEFSTRSRDIKAAMVNETDKSAKNISRVTIKTRPPKHEQSPNKLFTQWQKIGRSHGWGPEQAKALVEMAEEKAKEKIPVNWRDDYVAYLMERAGEQAHKTEARTNTKKKSESFKAKETTGKKSDFKEPLKESKSSNGKPYFRFERRWLARRAPKFSPLYGVKISVPVFGKTKTKNWWGKVRFEIKTPFGHLQFRDRRLFPNAPEWNPAKNWMLPRFVLRQDTQWKWREVLWKKNTAFGQLQLRRKALFPHAKEGSAAHKLAIPAFRLQTKRPKPQNEEVIRQRQSH